MGSLSFIFVCSSFHLIILLVVLLESDVYLILSLLYILLQSRSLFVKNLNFSTSDESLRKHFSERMKEGEILSVKVSIFPL